MAELHVVKMENKEGRYIIAEKESGKLICDAQGCGYKSFMAAKKAMWYKFGGGKKKIDLAKSEALKFWKENKAVKSFVDYLYECNCKDIAMGVVSEEELIAEVKEKTGVVVKAGYLKYL